MSKKTSGPTFFPPLGPAKVSGGLVPTGWDRCVLADQVLPGYASILRAGIKLKIDPKKKSGANGTNPTFHGLDPQPLELELLTYSDDDREALASFVRRYAPQPNKTPQPVSIDYPGLRHIGITKVQIVGVSALIPVSPGVAKQLFELTHWEPPAASGKSATTTPTRVIRNLRKEAQKALTAGQAAKQAVEGFFQDLHLVRR